MEQEKTCPHCGAKLHGEATFCPCCANDLNQRTEQRLPKRIPRRLLQGSLLLLLLFAMVLLIRFRIQPRSYDGLGEVLYTDADGSYQLLLSPGSDRYQPMAEYELKAGDEEHYRFPLKLYVNHTDSGANAGGIFLQKVTAVEAAIEQPDGSKRPISCTPPAPDTENFPEAALVSFVDLSRDSPESTQIVWTIHMQNGDRITLRFGLHITPVNTYTFRSEHTDLSTAAALQDFIDRLSKDPSIQALDIVRIELPPVTYTEPIILHGRAFDLIGSEADGKRTTFSAGIQIRRTDTSWISHLSGFDVTGSGEGVGLSAANRVWIEACRFTGWKTSVLAYGRTWVNAFDCTFSDNTVGLYFNAPEGNPADTRFTGNTFSDNGTAVLLEQLPSDTKLDFENSVFSGNRTDIDNRCAQPLDLSRAVFQ